MKKLMLFVLLGMINLSALAQSEDFQYPSEKDYPRIINSASSVSAFIPKGWKAIGKAEGDLNADGAKDAVLIIKGRYQRFLNKNENLGSAEYDTNPRIMLILFWDKNSSQYRLIEQSNSFIIYPESPTMEEPFQGVSIKSGLIVLDFEEFYSAGTWYMANRSYKFKYLNGSFKLIGADKTSVIRNSGEMESRSYNFLTRKVKITSAAIESDGPGKVSWKTINFKNLKSLKSFKKAFSWEIEPDYYL